MFGKLCANGRILACCGLLYPCRDFGRDTSRLLCGGALERFWGNGGLSAVVIRGFTAGAAIRSLVTCGALECAMDADVATRTLQTITVVCFGVNRGPAGCAGKRSICAVVLTCLCYDVVSNNHDVTVFPISEKRACL